MTEAAPLTPAELDEMRSMTPGFFGGVVGGMAMRAATAVGPDNKAEAQRDFERAKRLADLFPRLIASARAKPSQAVPVDVAGVVERLEGAASDMRKYKAASLEAADLEQAAATIQALALERDQAVASERLRIVKALEGEAAKVRSHGGWTVDAWHGRQLGLRLAIQIVKGAGHE